MQKSKQRTAHHRLKRSLSLFGKCCIVALASGSTVALATVDVVHTTSSTVSGIEDNSIPLNVEIDPAFFDGGKQLDVIGTEIGFRDASTPSTSTATFTVPAGAAHVRIRGAGGSNDAASSSLDEEFLLTDVTVDLAAETYSGIVRNIFDGSIANSNYSFTDVELGEDSSTGTVTGADPVLTVTVSLSGNTLSVTDNQSFLDQAYLVEYLANENSSGNLLGNTGVVLDSGVLNGSVTLPADAAVLDVKILHGRPSNNFRNEDKGSSNISVDVASKTASGNMFFQSGSGEDNTVAYSFSNYDLSSGLPILDSASGAITIGDSVAVASNLPNPTLSLTGSTLTMTRSSDFANNTISMLQTSSYSRLSVGSIATRLNSSSVSFESIGLDGNIDVFDLAIPLGAETGIVNFGQTPGQGVVLVDENNENSGFGNMFVDLDAGTTSGFFFTARLDEPDFISWSSVPFGTRLIDGNHVSNKADESEFADQFSAILSFSLATDDNGDQVLRGTAEWNQNDRDYYITANADWSGPTPITVTASGNGTFSAGDIDPVTGLLVIDPADAPTLSFVPDTHYSGNDNEVTVTHGAQVDLVNIDVVAAADPATLTTLDQPDGQQNLPYNISGGIEVALVDTDGSESISAIDVTLTPGHTLSDGTNSFTASASGDTVNIVAWTLSSLSYTSPDAGAFPVAVRAVTTDSDGFSPSADTTEALSSFNVTILGDADADGIPDADDLDDDNDGIPDSVEGAGDTDGDGLVDSLDRDSDNDGITDTVEAGGVDADGNGIIDGLTDNNDDGLDDATATTPLPVSDTDNDGDRNFQDTDSDNDGLADQLETGSLDTDGDNILNYLDSDSDGDGIPDSVEGNVDTDGDNTPNYLDQDSDNDGIPDGLELVGDGDGDNLPDYLDPDSDGDGIPDASEGNVDTDTDGTPDFRDEDSDNDGIPDSVELANDTDGDNVPDYRDEDSDADGISDADEGHVDTDADGTPDFRDEDSDGDGVSDADEGSTDTDGDGVPDFLDPDTDDSAADIDSDNDGIPDSVEGTVDSDNDGTQDFLDLDSDNDGIPDSVELAIDSDGDSIPDYRDLDSDSDGILDSVELAVDTDGDVIANYLDRDSDNDGLLDALEGVVDTDGDGTSDYLDLDSDADSIPDMLEAGSDPANPNDSDGDGVLDFREQDSDNDGIADSVEAGNDPSNPVDTDADGVADFRDLDSDNDGIDDASEGSGDADGNGTPDFQEVAPTAGPQDTDGDGVIDSLEGTGDTDGDGIPNNLDLDSDNDGIADALEVGNDLDNPIDTDGDGFPDFLDRDADNDGLLDSLEGVVDSDGDGVSDFLDLDSDNDGLPDVWESTGPAADLDVDGMLDDNSDLDGDGVADNVSVNNVLDTDIDGTPDHLDLDSDGDGLVDLVEAGGADVNDDGLVDQWVDSDGDGIPDGADVDVTGGEDNDGDGIDDFADADFVALPDTDGDGIVDPFDDDMLGDGFLPIVVNGVELTTNDLPDTDGDNIPDVLDVSDEPDSLPAQTILTGLSGGGCSIGPANPNGPMDPMFALLALTAAIGTRWRRKLRITVA